MERRLSAILLTDMVGYSRLIGRDEAGTITRQKVHREEIFDLQISIHGGRIVKSTGDGLLAEFQSVVDAANCAIEIQNEMGSRDAEVDADLRIQYRIGINLGDIVIDGDDILGDGVNIAARLEALAEPGSICVSGAVYDQIRGRVEAAFVDLGDRNLKNIASPVRVWQWKEGAVGVAPPPPSEKPSIAVLAFDNMSPDPEHTYFGDGLAEDIISTLSKISSLIVIARNSSFAYKNRAIDLRTVGSELGVRYVLEGSVRAAGGRLRITAQLIDASTGSHAWAERYDRKLEDIFAIQDEITREIVTALRAQLSDGEEAQLWLRGTESVQAWAAVMAAHECIFASGADNLIAAHEHLTRAISIDPNYAAAHALIGQTIWMQLRFGLVEDKPRAVDELGAAGTCAAALEPTNALAQIVLAAHAQFSGDNARAYELGRRAIELSPNNAFIRVSLGRILIFLGQPREAEEHLRLALRLNPYGPVVQHGILANALERQSKDEAAIAVLRQATSRHPDYLSGHLRLASLLGQSGEFDDAAHHLAEAQRLRPNFDRAALEDFYGTDDPTALARFLSGLQRAGLQF